MVFVEPKSLSHQMTTRQCKRLDGHLGPLSPNRLPRCGIGAPLHNNTPLEWLSCHPAPSQVHDAVEAEEL